MFSQHASSEGLLVSGSSLHTPLMIVFKSKGNRQVLKEMAQVFYWNVMVLDTWKSQNNNYPSTMCKNTVKS
jgi:hypothetical protein